MSDKIHIRTFTPAEIGGYEIDVTPPEYAARLAAKVEQPNFEVLRGSEVDYRVRAIGIRADSSIDRPSGLGMRWTSFTRART